jgi:hypothetical protein
VICGADFSYSAARLSVPSKTPEDSNKYERGAAMVLRSFLFLLLVYIIFHKIFPFALFTTRLADMTGADLLLLIFRTLLAIAGAGYFAVRGFVQPDLQDRDRLWCERWAGAAFGVIAITLGSVLITSLQGEGIIFALAYAVASGILWLLF